MEVCTSKKFQVKFDIVGHVYEKKLDRSYPQILDNSMEYPGVIEKLNALTSYQHPSNPLITHLHTIMLVIYPNNFAGSKKIIKMKLLSLTLSKKKFNTIAHIDTPQKVKRVLTTRFKCKKI